MLKRIAKHGELSYISEQRNSLLFWLSWSEQYIVNIPVYKITLRCSWQLQGSSPWLTAQKNPGQQIGARCLLLKCLQVLDLLLFDCWVSYQNPRGTVQQLLWLSSTDLCHSHICTAPCPLTGWKGTSKATEAHNSMATVEESTGLPVSGNLSLLAMHGGRHTSLGKGDLRSISGGQPSQGLLSSDITITDLFPLE